MNIRRKTCLIVRKDGKYFVAYCPMTQRLKWSESIYDAWRTRDKNAAIRASRILGGVPVLFNPIVGQIADYKPKEGLS